MYLVEPDPNARGFVRCASCQVVGLERSLLPAEAVDEPAAGEPDMLGQCLNCSAPVFTSDRLAAV